MTTVEGLQKAIKNRPVQELPSSINSKVDVRKDEVDGFPVYTIQPKGEKTPKMRILYIHGGSFVFSLSQYHWLFIADAAERLNAKITVPLYPLGPEYKIIDMYNLLQPIYGEMATEESDSPFVGMGDSAGATLLLGLTMTALEAGASVAQKLVLSSPAMDFTFQNPDVYTAEKNDPFLATVGLKEAVRLTQGDLTLDDKRISPINGNTNRLPPTLMFVGELDLLGPDEQLFANSVKSSGGDIEVVKGEGMLHNWVIFPIPEGKTAQNKVMEWLAV
mgnify:CR=1 FL=1